MRAAVAPDRPWQIIRRNKTNAVLGLAIGLALGCAAKYVAAAFLVLFTLAGGQ